eukprot:8794-Hanusia_phi.AAC.1
MEGGAGGKGKAGPASVERVCLRDSLFFQKRSGSRRGTKIGDEEYEIHREEVERRGGREERR